MKKAQYITGDGKPFATQEAAIAHANEVANTTGDIIAVEAVPRISKAEYNYLRKKIAAHEKWRAGRRAVKTSDIPAGLRVRNDQRSAVEVYEFMHEPPEKYVAYVSKHSTLTTWTGDVLGEITFGSQWKSNMGDTRQAIRVRAINGRTYAGTYFKSAGDYARLKIAKEKGEQT